MYEKINAEKTELGQKNIISSKRTNHFFIVLLDFFHKLHLDKWFVGREERLSFFIVLLDVFFVNHNLDK